MQPKKRAWSVGRKGAPATSNKESWREWKALQEKKKKQDASSDSDTSEKGVIHHSGIVAIVSAKSWASVVSNDDDDELPHSLGSTSLAKREC